MPRYRFSWENLKPSLLKQLALSFKIEGAWDRYIVIHDQ